VAGNADRLIPSCFQDETNYGTVSKWRDHDVSTKGWWHERDESLLAPPM
jgi:hypothetical protein